MMFTEYKSQKHPTMAEVVEELKRMTNIAFPIATMSLLNYIKNMVLVICMGRLGSLELAGGALAVGFTNITGYSLLSGLASGMEPLCSQAFGSKNPVVASLTLQRTIVMLLIASLPITFLWLNIEPLMLILHQDPHIARIASSFCHFAIPDLVANSVLHPLRIYLRSKGVTWPLMWCTSVSTLLHIPITMFLSFTISLGVPGVAISTFITNFNTLFLLLSYLYFYPTPGQSDLNEEGHLYTPVSAEALLPTPDSNNIKTSKVVLLGEEWKVLLQLAIPSCLAVCLEWWWYEFMTILAGYLSTPRVALATSAIVIQTTSLMYTLPTSLSASVSTRVGNELGAGRPEKARLATLVAIGLALMGSLLGLSWTTLGREAWGKIFTNDSEVLELTMIVLPIIGVCELANCPQTTSCGILRGSARPTVGACINFGSFYLVGAPVAIVLGFVFQIGFVGLCYGLLAAQIVCVVSILIVVYQTDWDCESSKAKNLVAKSCTQQTVKIITTSTEHGTVDVGF